MRPRDGEWESDQSSLVREIVDTTKGYRLFWSCDFELTQFLLVHVHHDIENMSVFGSQYLHNLSYNSYGVGGFVDLRIAKGLAFNIGGNYSRVNDQLSLRRGQLSDNQVIARQQQLATNFRYFINFGLSYTFGSIFNSVVNPRFGGGGGGGQMMMMSF